MPDSSFELMTTAEQRREIRLAMGLDPVPDLGMVERPATEAKIAIVMPCSMAGQRLANAHKERCAECQAEVWVAPATPAGARRVCLQCAPKMLSDA